MVFVTVGTHEQQFDRLVKAVDDLKADGTLDEPVYIQTGYSTYEPVHCDHSQFVPFRQMKSFMEGADVVITQRRPLKLHRGHGRQQDASLYPAGATLTST